MSIQKMMVNEVDPEGKWLYRVGGIAALILGIAYIITIPLYGYVGAPPNGAETRLVYLSGNITVWWAILGLMVLTDFLFVPVALSLYLALKKVSRNAMLMAIAFVGLFIVLDLAITWPNYASLIALSGKYAVAANDAQRAIYAAAANYAAAVLDSSLEPIYAILTLSIGILITGLAMLKGIFGKVTAYLGLAVGASGIVAVAGPFFVKALSVAIIINAGLATVWILFVGYRLIKLGQR